MCDKAFYAFLPTLAFVPDCFVTTKIIEKLYNVIVSNDLLDLHGKDIVLYSLVMKFVLIL